MKFRFFCCDSSSDNEPLLENHVEENKPTRIKEMLDELKNRISAYQSAKDKNNRDAFLFMGAGFSDKNFLQLLDAVNAELVSYSSDRKRCFVDQYYTFNYALASNSLTELRQGFQNRTSAPTDLLVPLSALSTHIGERPDNNVSSHSPSRATM